MATSASARAPWLAPCRLAIPYSVTTMSTSVRSAVTIAVRATMLLTGECAYDGLHAYVSITFDGDVGLGEAAVLDNSLPPAPDPIEA